MNEIQIQAKSVLWFSQEFPERRGDYFATFQETSDAAQGASMLSKGLVPGVPDTFLIDDGIFTGVEWKAPNTRHDIYHILEQCRFLLKNCYTGWFCTSLEMFQGIVMKNGVGIDPTDIVNKCVVLIEKKIDTEFGDDIDDLLFRINQWSDKEKKKRKTKSKRISIGTIKF